MKKNDLYDLVHSLTKSEKRHFQLKNRRQGETVDYFRLFEILDKIEVFDEKKLKNVFPEQVNAGQLHVTKNYLREKILESLRQFHSQISRDALVKDFLKNVEIFFYKELYTQASDELARAEKLAAEYELHTAQIEVSRWKRRLEQTLHPHRYDRFAEILEEQRRATDALQNNLEHWQHIVHTSQRFMQYAAVIPKPEGLPSEPPPAQSLESNILYFNSLYIKNLREGNPEQAENALQKLLKILEAQPARVKEDPGSCLTTVGNLAAFRTFRGEGEAALELLRSSRLFWEKIGIPDRRRPVLKQLVRLLNIELEIYRTAENPAQFEDFFRETGEFVKKVAPKIPDDYLLSFHFQLAWVCFLKRDFDLALDWLSEPLNESRKHAGQPVFRYLLLLNLMVHCELRNVFVLRYFVENARRQFKKSGELAAWEQELLAFFTKTGQSAEGDWKGLRRDLQQRLFPETAPSLVPEEVLRMLDFRRWLC
ncbi:MAG: hypothetical protein JNN28_15220 [Saprospiraceae bacterium]|nr:hypothetical protein [Saprospiraceae bacterium]